jgi:hypothetical protein
MQPNDNEQGEENKKGTKSSMPQDSRAPGCASPRKKERESDDANTYWRKESAWECRA